MKALHPEIGHKLTIAYRGTDFFGWQRQGEKRTVQECLEAALRAIWGRQIDLQGSGRTDTGVHATGQIDSEAACVLLQSYLDSQQRFSVLPPEE